MNTGQMMLTIGALALLSIITLRYFETVAQSGQNLVQSNSGLTATTIATSFIERAQNLNFDEISDGTPFNQLQDNPALLTDPGSLGTDDANEASSLDSLDDFDDFNYYNEHNPLIFVPEGLNENYNVEFSVYYVDTSNVNVTSGVGYETFIKKMDVRVYRIDAFEGVDTIKLSTIYGLFRYNVN